MLRFLGQHRIAALARQAVGHDVNVAAGWAGVRGEVPGPVNAPPNVLQLVRRVRHFDGSLFIGGLFCRRGA